MRLGLFLLLQALVGAPVFASLSFVFNGPADVAVTAAGYTAAGPLDLTLNFQPVPGQHLSVVKNTGNAFISGTFENVAQGATVPLSYNGVTYHYIANYYGGNGRSLVLHWPQSGVYSWGSNQYLQLGNGGIRDHPNPVRVWMNGALAGSTVTKVAAGENSGFAVTADGRVFGWGANLSGELGTSIGNSSRVPVPVDASGVLASRIIVDVAAGDGFTLALDATGKAYGWGRNGSGQLGNGTSNSSTAPVAVDMTGVLAGKSLVRLAAGYSHALGVSSEGKAYAWGSNFTSALGPIAVDDSGVLSGRVITSVAAGSYFSLALADDGRVYSWGNNQWGQLGDNSFVNRSVPVAVDPTGVLAGKAVIAIAAGSDHALALTSDGQVHAWGFGFTGKLGNNTRDTQSVPVSVDRTGAMAGKFIVAIAAGNSRSMALASDGSVFEWGWIDGAPQLSPRLASPPGGWPGVGVSGIAAGALHGMALGASGPPVVSRHPAAVSAAAGATVSFHAAVEAAHPAQVKWQVSTAGPAGPFVDITGNPSATTPTLTLNGITAAMHGQVFRAVFSNESGSSATNGTALTVVDWTATLATAGGAAFESEAVVASGPLNLTLAFNPAPGTDLTVIRNTGTAFISGRFSNLAQGAPLSLTHGGTSYDFVANYFGGNGRSLVLQWKRTRLVAWGYNHAGRLGDGTETDRTSPVDVAATGGLAGKTIVNVCAGGNFSLALTSDGRVFAWGSGPLGTGDNSSSMVPVEITASGPLAGKSIVSIAAAGHCLALTEEGQVYGWRFNDDYQLGLGYYAFSILIPTLLDAPGVFGGRPVVAISAGQNHSLALTSDGRVFAWGSNYSGKTGLGMTTDSTTLPTEIITSEELGGRPVVAIEAGYGHSLALAADGTLFAWGDEDALGTDEPFVFSSPAPARVRADGALAGVTFAKLSAAWHSLALSDDGRVFAWGTNGTGQLGTGDVVARLLPVEVTSSGALAGKTITGISSGQRHSVASALDGTCFTWGANDKGQLGNGTTTASPLPVQVAGTPLRVLSVDAGGDFTVARVDQGLPVITHQPSPVTAAAGATVVFHAQADDPFGHEIHWQISPTGAAGPFQPIAGNPSATTTTLVLPEVTTGDDASAYRAVFITASGTIATEPATLEIVNWSATLTAADSPPFVVDGVVASGNIDLTLGFAPPAGTDLTVIRNLGSGLIDGFFSNLPQGGRVTLTHQGVAYDFITDYFGGGNGRSLVLRWPWTSLTAWGANNNRQLGDGTTTNRNAPVSSSSSALAGKSIVKTAAGDGHNLLATADGLVLGWGLNNNGQTGVGGLPAGPLQGKTIAAIAGGGAHSLALCADGSIYAWGQNLYGALGDGTTTSSNTPVAVKTDGALSGRKPSAVAAGSLHSLLLTADGSVFAWGYNFWGQLGNGTTTTSNVPVRVNSTGALAGRRITAIAAGDVHSLALSADGSVFAWGSNGDGQLGDGTTIKRATPVPVLSTGALAGKTVVAISAGEDHSLALTADGIVYAWGGNDYGQLGDGTTTRQTSPAAVLAPAGWGADPIVAIAAGDHHSLALTASGVAFAWGRNLSGQLGNGGTTQSGSPVPVNATGVLAGRRVRSIHAGGSHSLAVFANAGLPIITATPRDVTCFHVSSATVEFTAAAVDVFAYQVRWQRSVSGINGPFEDLTENPTANSTTLSLTGLDSAANGHAFRAVFSNNIGSVATTAAVLTMQPIPATLHFPNPSHVPVTAANAVLSGAPIITLGFAPMPGTRLTLVRNTGGGFLAGGFENLVQGAEISLSFHGRSHRFVVDSFGENGRSLVLHWADQLAAGWGAGSSGQLGNGSNSSTNRTPVAVTADGVMAGETLVKLAAGNSHSLALAASGRIFAWGDNTSGKLGNGSTTASNVPVLVNANAVLAGKTVTSIAAGTSHTLAVMSDGHVAAWGSNASGQLGTGGPTAGSAMPAAVSRSGVLAGKTVTAIAAGNAHSVALLSDGTMVAWGMNSSGQLGSGNTTLSAVPVAVVPSGALAGKSVVQIAAGADHNLALTADGRVYSWGANQEGQLGNGSSFPQTSTSPLAVSGSGLIAGQTVIAIAAGTSHSLALTSDGKVYAWGSSRAGQLGTGSSSPSFSPVAVNTSGVLAGKSVVAIAAGGSHSLAIDSNGFGYAWGSNSAGQLGSGTFRGESFPVALSTQGAVGSRPLTAIAAGEAHTLAIAGKGTAPSLTQSPASQTVVAGSTVIFTAAADGYPAPTVRWQRSTTGPGGTFSDLAGQTTTTLQLSNVAASQTGYAYRALFTNQEASTNSTPAVLTVQSTFASFLVARGLPENSPALDDPFATGVPNLLAYAFDLNPAAPDRKQLPTSTVVGGRLRISYIRLKNAPGLTYLVEVSNELAAWQSGPGITETVSVTSIDNTRERVVDQELFSGASPARFLRVRVVLTQQ
jgi:alpha-tubulin suppressor-like RCC1 family protein